MKKTILFTCISALILLTGCQNKQSSQSKEKSQNIGYPLIIDTYKTEEAGQVRQTKIELTEKPKRVVANTQGAAELLLQIGVAQELVGIAALYGETDPAIKEAFQKIPVLNQQYATKEQVVAAKPDLVIGRSVSFANDNWGHGTTQDLKSLNIASYIQKTTIRGATFKDLYVDLENLGNVFNQKDRAQKFTVQIQESVKKIENTLSNISNTKSFAYLSIVEGNKLTVYTANNETFFNDSLKLLKLKNIFEQETVADVGIEQLIKANPDFLFLSSYTGGPSTKKMIADLYQNPALKPLKAIQKKQVFVLPFHQFWTNSYTVLDGLNNLGKEIYPKEFGPS